MEEPGRSARWARGVERNWGFRVVRRGSA